MPGPSILASFTMYTLCLEYMGLSTESAWMPRYQVHAYAWTVSDAYEIGIGSVFHEKAGLAPAVRWGPRHAGRYKAAVRQISLLWFFADTLRS